MFALATTLTDWQRYLPESWPGCTRAGGRLGDHDRAGPAITGAGRATGPILRSGTPHQVTQEMWAWTTATQLLRIHGARAAAGQHASGPHATPPAPDRVPFTLTRREAVRAMTQTLAPATLPGALAAAAEHANRRILASLLPVRPPRHRERRVETRPQFHPAGGRRVPASTGPAEITIWHAGQITYADGHTSQPPAHSAATRPSRHDTVPRPGRRQLTARPVEPAPSPERHPGHHHARPHQHNSQTRINGTINLIYPRSHLTPKSDAIGPSGATCPCPQRRTSTTPHPLWISGTMGSRKVMLTDVVVAALACDANAGHRSSRAPEASMARKSLFMISPLRLGWSFAVGLPGTAGDAFHSCCHGYGGPDGMDLGAALGNRQAPPSGGPRAWHDGVATGAGLLPARAPHPRGDEGGSRLPEAGSSSRALRGCGA